MKVHSQALARLQKSLTDLEYKIIMTSNKVLEDRTYAISEIRYYKKLLQSYFEYPKELQVNITVDLSETLEVIEEWLQEQD